MADHDSMPHPLATQRELQHIPAIYLIALAALMIFVIFFVIAN